MVTKKKIVTPEMRLKQATVYPKRVLHAYRRRDDIGVVSRIRYDPNYAEATLEDSLCAEYSDGFYFLSRLHYQQLIFSLAYFPWHLEINYEEFMKIFTNFFDSSGLNSLACYIITFTLFRDGNVELAAYETSPIENMFAGLLDHVRILHGEPVESDDESEAYMVEHEPLPVYIDTDFTMPCKFSVFDLTDKVIYEEAAIRVKQDYQLDDELDAEKFDVLLWSCVQYTMSTLDSVVAVFKDDEWFVPHASSGGRQDPLRMVLLEQGIVQEALFNVQRLEPGEDVLLISSQYGIRRGVLQGRLPEPLSRYSRNRKSKPSVLKKRTEIQVHNSEVVAQRTSEAVRTNTECAITGIPGTSVLKFDKPKPR